MYLSDWRLPSDLFLFPTTIRLLRPYRCLPFLYCLSEQTRRNHHPLSYPGTPAVPLTTSLSQRLLPGNLRLGKKGDATELNPQTYLLSENWTVRIIHALFPD